MLYDVVTVAVNVKVFEPVNDDVASTVWLEPEPNVQVVDA